MTPSRRIVTLSCWMAALAGCSGSADTNVNGELSGATNEDDTGFACVGALCTCTGKGDCDAMFGSGTCGAFASCDRSALVTECKCVALRSGNGTKHPPGWRPSRTHEHL